jgi:hypothetical protein
MDHREFRAFVQKMRQLLIDKTRSDYRVGEALARIRTERLFETWPRDDRRQAGYDSFAEFCERELGYSHSTAMQKASNFERLSALNLPDDGDTFARCMRLGWSKLNTLLRVARDEKTLVAWLNDIEGKNLTEMQLRTRIEEARAHHLRTHAQTNDEAEEADDEDEPAEAPHAPTRPTTRGYVGMEVRFESQAALDAFTRAVDMIRRRYGGDMGMGRAIEMMAVQYVASTPTAAQGGAAVEVENLLRMIESAYGVRLQVAPAQPRARKRPAGRAR